jgi:hypothetical protein
LIGVPSRLGLTRKTAAFASLLPTFALNCDFLLFIIIEMDKERVVKKTNIATRLTYTGLPVGLEHLKIETRLIDETFASVMGEYMCS